MYLMIFRKKGSIEIERVDLDLLGTKKAEKVGVRKSLACTSTPEDPDGHVRSKSTSRHPRPFKPDTTYLSTSILRSAPRVSVSLYLLYSISQHSLKKLFIILKRILKR